MSARKNRRRPDCDPVVEEIRAVRKKLLAEAGGTVEGYLRLMRRRTRDRVATGQRAASPRRKSA